MNFRYLQHSQAGTHNMQHICILRDIAGDVEHWKQCFIHQCRTFNTALDFFCLSFWLIFQKSSWGGQLWWNWKKTIWDFILFFLFCFVRFAGGCLFSCELESKLGCILYSSSAIRLLTLKTNRFDNHRIDTLDAIDTIER